MKGALVKNSALRRAKFLIHAHVATLVALIRIGVLTTVLLPGIANATLLNKTIYANPDFGLWRYSYDRGPNPNVNSSSAFPTSLSQFSSATYVGYVRGPDTTTSIAADLWQGVIDSRTVHVFGTYVISNVTQAVTLSFTGDDGHSAFVDGTFVAGGGFGVLKQITLNLSAYAPVLLEIVGYNYGGGSVWAIGTCNAPCTTGSDWTNAIRDLPGLTVTPVLPSPYSLEYLQKAYVAYYGRPADPAGQLYWALRMDTENGSLDGIIPAFGSSTEFNTRYGGLSFADLVTRIYQQALGRNPDPAGLSYYVTELQAGRRTLQRITLDVLNGATTAPDSTIIANKLEVSRYYTAKVAAGCPYGTEQDGVDAIGSVTAEAASVAAAKAAFDAWCAH